MKFQNVVIGHAKFLNGKIFDPPFNNYLSIDPKNIKFNRFLYFSADWYKGRLTDKQLDELENPPTTTTGRPKTKKGSSRRKHPKLQQREEEQPADE